MPNLQFCKTLKKTAKIATAKRPKDSHIPTPSTEFTLSAAEWAQNRLSKGTYFTQPLLQGRGSPLFFIPYKSFPRQVKSFDFYILF